MGQPWETWLRLLVNTFVFADSSKRTEVLSPRQGFMTMNSWYTFAELILFRNYSPAWLLQFCKEEIVQWYTRGHFRGSKPLAYLKNSLFVLFQDVFILNSRWQGEDISLLFEKFVSWQNLWWFFLFTVTQTLKFDARLFFYWILNIRRKCFLNFRHSNPTFDIKVFSKGKMNDRASCSRMSPDLLLRGSFFFFSWQNYETSMHRQ